VADIETVNSQPKSSLSDPFCRYFARLTDMDVVDRELYFPEERSNEEGTIFCSHLTAKSKMKLGRYSEAYHILKKLLSSDHDIPAPMLYFIFSDLEVCCRELSDYRGAYEYSADRTGMLEKFLG
jgi:hypothetical protein